jgi:predicted GH43/DUF377 family glycosyl hydrolase
MESIQTGRASVHILHFTSADGVTWKYINTCTLSSERVIDPMVYRIKDTWYMVYKDEAVGSRTYRSESKDLIEWTRHQPATPDGRQEAPFVFRWKSAYWMIVDSVNSKSPGLRIYKSADGVRPVGNTTSTILDKARRHPAERQQVGHHPGIVVQQTGDGWEQCLLFYFTHQERRTVMQLAELELGADGKASSVNRNKYAREQTVGASLRGRRPDRTKGAPTEGRPYRILSSCFTFIRLPQLYQGSVVQSDPAQPRKLRDRE